MPITEYKQGERCFLVNDVSILEMEAPYIILEKFGYPPLQDTPGVDEEGNDIIIKAMPQSVKDKWGITDKITMGMLFQTWAYVTIDGVKKVAYDVQIPPYHNFELGSTAADDAMTEQNFDLAKLQYGVTEFLSEEEYKAYLPLENQT